MRQGNDRSRGEILATCSKEANFQSLSFSYVKKNYLLSREYDLAVSFGKSVTPCADARIALSFRGGQRRFRTLSGTGDFIHDLAEVLNSEDARKIFEPIEFINLDITLNARESRATVTAKTLFGSATWLMIPPGFQYITPHKQECHGLLESLDFIAYMIDHMSSRRAPG